MAYYPKNKIKTDQVSTGEYAFLSNGEVYIGSYYKLYNGKAYTGKFPGDGSNKELIELKDPLDIPSTPQSLTTTTIPPLFPTPDDYTFGSFIRYFFKKRNEYLFKELTKKEYDDLNKPSNPLFNLYKPFFITWLLTGEKQTVTDFNFYSIKSTEEKEKVLGLNEFLQMNYLQYYKG